MALALFLLGIVLSGTVGSELEPSSGPTQLDILRELIEEVKDIKESVAILAENDQTLSQALDKTAEESEALKREFRELLSNLSQQVEEVQSVLTCTGQPPSQQNGRTVHFGRKHGSVVLYRCDVDFDEAENSIVRCHLGKWEGRPPLCTRPALPLRVHVKKDYPWPVANVTCWTEESGQPVRFNRLLDTGTGGALPTAARTFTRDGLAVLDLSGVPAEDKRGVFQCGHVNRTGVTFVIDRDGSFRRPQVASVGDTVKLPFYFPMTRPYSDDPSLRWLHDGQRVEAWDGRARVEIAGVGKQDAGFYERYEEGDRRRTQRFSRLVVRGCPDGFFGQRCDQQCSTCDNGGQCHVKLGTCVCAPGFTGRRCEEECGPDCSEACDGGDCLGQVLCQPDPYGCSCAAGYRGYECQFIGI